MKCDEKKQSMEMCDSVGGSICNENMMTRLIELERSWVNGAK